MTLWRPASSWGRRRKPAPKPTLSACREAAEPCPPWAVPQHISRPPRGDQAAFLLVLPHPSSQVRQLGRLVGRAPEVWRGLLTVPRDAIQFRWDVSSPIQGSDLQKFYCNENPIKMNIYQSPSGVCYIEKLDCSLLFPVIYLDHTQSLEHVSAFHPCTGSVQHSEAQVSAEPLGMAVIKAVWGKGWLVVLNQRPQIIQTRCQERSGLNSRIMLPRG